MSHDGHLDFETYSELDVRKVGGHRYARHPSTEVLIACYKLPGMREPAVWLPRTEEPPEDLMEYIRRGGKLRAHNVGFERNVWRHALRRQCPGIPDVPDAQWVCTAAKAAASGLPRSLDGGLAALGLPVRKDPDGPKLIKKFSKPRKPTKKDARRRILPEQDTDFQKFIRYCQTDVRGEEALDAAIPDLSSREAMFFRMDMRMNDRGLPLDLPLVRKAYAVVQALEDDLKRRMEAKTGGIRGTQVAKLKAFFEEQGLELENMRADTVKELLKSRDIEPHLRELLEMRVEAGKASTKKLASMLLVADPDDWIVQGCFLFHGAHTGRYAGRLVQPQNFIRGKLKDRQRDLVFALLEHGDPELFMLLYENPIDAIAQSMRGFIRAPQGYELAVVDYTAIEARVLAWVAGEEHMLKAYRKGVDVYKLMAMKLWKLGSIEEVSDEQRRIAKNLVLGCGYQLGGERFVEYAANAGCIIEPEFAFLAVKVYRKEHPQIVKSWRKVEDLVVNAIRNPGETYEGLQCRFYMREHWLCIQLPSGREIRYPFARATLGERYGRPHFQISFRTEYHGRFYRENTYGGKLIENIVQGIARDIMMEGMWQAERNDYPPVGTVHDELLALRRKGTTNVKELEETVCSIPTWGRGIPLAAKGFVTDRYKKD